MLVSIIAIMTLYHVVILKCCLGCGLVCLISIPIRFPYGVVALFGTRCFDVPSLFLCFFGLVFYFVGLSIFVFGVWFRYMSDCIAVCLSNDVLTEVRSDSAGKKDVKGVRARRRVRFACGTPACLT
jgi:hypothetical protein